MVHATFKFLLPHHELPITGHHDSEIELLDMSLKKEKHGVVQGAQRRAVRSVEYMIRECFFLHRLLNVMYEFAIHLGVKDGEE